MADVVIRGTHGRPIRLRDMGDQTFTEVVSAVMVDQSGNPIPAGADRELLVTTYACKQAWTGVSVGNVLRSTETIDVSGAVSTTVSTRWQNLSTGSDVGAPPNVPDYTTSLTQGDALTLAQLLSAGLATASNQVTQIGYLADIAQGQGRYTAYSTQQVDEATAGTTYIRKAGSDAGDTWLIQRVVESGTNTTISYAGVRNNPTVTTAAAAWTGRASLTYGELGGA